VASYTSEKLLTEQEMRGKSQRIARPAWQCRPLASSSETQTCCLLVNVDELTRVRIDACCTQLSHINYRSTR